MRVVVDTNVFVSSFPSPGGAPRKIIDLWKTGELIFCLSRAIIEEYILVLVRLGLKGEPELDELLELFKDKSNILFTAPAGDLRVVEADPDDDKFIECALHAKAGFLVSGDKHLLDIERFEGIRIVTPGKFLKVFHQED